MKSDVNSFLDEFIKQSLGNQYVIPVYQRNYTWNKQHVKKLLGDIKDLLLNKKSYHFLGTIVYSAKYGVEVSEREIVDGQQRLTTMFLMLYALKSIALELGDNDNAGRLTEEYLENKFVTDKYKLRLKPLVSDDNVYQLISENKMQCIEQDEKSRNSKVYINYKYIRDEFSKWIINEKYDILTLRKAIDKLKIVYIQIEESDDAQSIFERINSTGETLTPADLIRNYILMNKTNDIQEKYYEEYWLKLEKYMNEDSKTIAEFLRFYLASKTFSLCNQNMLYDTFKLYWESKLENEEENLIDLVRYASYYYVLYFLKEEDIPYLKESIKELRRIKSNMPAPFLMEMLNLYEKNIITQSDIKSIIEIINIYMIRRHMMKLDTSDITRLFPQILHRVLILANQYSYVEIVEIVKKCLINDNRQKSSFMPDDGQLYTYLLRANSYALSPTRLILDRIEQNNNNAPVDLSKLSIEHIMPQTPNEYWLKNTNGDRQEYDVQINRIGNLTLVSKPDNSTMGNSTFENKKRVMDDTKHIKLNEYILESTEWTLKQIDERTSTLIAEFLKLFPYSDSKKEYIDKENEKMIHIDRNGIYAEAILKTTKEVEVLAGSCVNYSVEPNGEKNKTLRDELIEDGIISVTPDGDWMFTCNYLFNSLSESSNVILGGKHNGYVCWMDEAGMSLSKTTMKNSEQIEYEMDTENNTEEHE